MRFFITCQDEPVEVIGHEISIPSLPGETFAVHYSAGEVVGRLWQPFTVSHVETGLAVATGDSIDDAIYSAQAMVRQVGAEFTLRKISSQKALMVKARMSLQ